MPEPGPAKRLIIYLGESDRWRNRSLYLSILETLRKAGIAGATVMRGLAGYGSHSIIRVSTVEALSVDLPITITVVDSAPNIERALALVGPMVREGLITLEDVQIVKYTHRHMQPLPADKPAAEVMTREVTTVTPDTPARDVVDLLLGKLFKAVPVIDQAGRPVGIISDDDLLRKAGLPIRLSVGQRLEPEELRGLLAQISREQTAGQVMTQPVHTVRADEALGYVVQKMLSQGLVRIPVVDANGRLVGMISRLDVLRAVAGNVAGTMAGDGGQQEHAPLLRQGKTLGEVMSPAVPVVHVNDDLVDVLQHMLQTGTQRVIVLDERDQAVGIITDGDLVARVSPGVRQNVLRALAERVLGVGLTRGQASAGEIMSKSVLSAPPQTTVTDAIALMLREGRKQLVVVDEQGKPVGLVDRQTLLAATLG